MIRFVVFDLGGVLVDWNPRYVYGKETTWPHSDSSLAPIDYFLNHVATGEWNSSMDAGVLFQQAIDQRKASFPQWAEYLQKWRDEWPTMVRGPIDGTVDIFSEVIRARKNGSLAGVYALSNWEANTFKIALARFPFLDWFDGRLISGEERMIKPDPRFFALLETRFGILPDQTLFIDDVLKNIEMAARLGFKTHHFSAPAALRDDLRRQGVIE